MDYRKLYAMLVGRVDHAVDDMEQDVTDPVRMRRVAERLKAALLEAEECYLSGGDDEE